ncbi:hypothetical protein MSAN_00294900 [Mycena sanguinolenta]|uniref:F-box domain-containing protein n=1 Tax=Mycena sanguinolenta TaxID=230812 RepID=A0A8H6ZEG0_9AGAR|nr:hypothetical protein MSAN_00294900 [Mycena sanguinolenta]
MDNAQTEHCADGCSVSTKRSAIPYLHILAAEIWLACWTLCSRRQLRRLSLVCKRFRRICLPLLFRHQTIETRFVPLKESNWVERLHSLHRAAVRLDSLRDSPHVGWVHSWNFGARKFLLPSETVVPHIGLIAPTHARLLNTFSTTLSLYHNLRSLDLWELIIDAPFRQTFSELRRLENLAFYSCDIVARNGFVMSLRSFTISAWAPISTAAEVLQEPLRIVAPEALHTLHLRAPDEIPSLLTAFGRAQFPHLVVLSWGHLSDLDIFLGFLAHCPALEVLKITTFHPDIIISLPRYTLSPDTIPVLRDLTVCEEMLGFFPFNRPIATVTILKDPPRPIPILPPLVSWEYLTPAVLNDLLTASVPLLSLSIDKIVPTLELLTSIASLFPQLQHLSIHLRVRKRRTHCHLGRRPPRRVSVDERYPVLRDADAFNDIPEDDLSDVEDSPPIARVRVPKELEASSSRSLQPDILSWICNGAAPLPQGIQVLRLIWNQHFSPAREHAVIAMLSYRYPHLRELEMERLILWARKGALWRKSDTDSYLEVVL